VQHFHNLFLRLRDLVYTERMTQNTPAPFADFPPEQRFINRETSWIAFNERVLEEANNPHNPLLERLKFLSISGSNLDEFYMVRVAGLKDQLLYGVSSFSIDGKSTEQQLKSIRKYARNLIEAQQDCWQELRDELDNEGVNVVDKEELNAHDRAWLKEYFMKTSFRCSPLSRLIRRILFLSFPI